MAKRRREFCERALIVDTTFIPSETMARITRQHPVDTTLPVESVQASLILGDVPRVSSKFDSRSPLP